MKLQIKIIILLLILIGMQLESSAQNAKLSEGAALLFKNQKAKLTIAEKNLLYQKMEFVLSKDKKQFVANYDAAKEDPFDANAYITDLNSDGNEEVFVSFGNTNTSGMAGSTIVIFIKDAAGVFQQNLGFPGLADLMPTSNKGYPDIVIGGPGFKFPVWRWNGTEYIAYKQISDSELGKLKTKSLAEAAKAYQAMLH